jgi:hypothetical protein
MAVNFKPSSSMGKRSTIITSVLIALTTTSLANQSGVKMKMKQTIPAKYGETIVFVQNQKIDFPDFTLLYTGSKVTSAQHSLQSSSKNFEVWNSLMKASLF